MALPQVAPAVVEVAKLLGRQGKETPGQETHPELLLRRAIQEIHIYHRVIFLVEAAAAVLVHHKPTVGSGKTAQLGQTVSLMLVAGALTFGTLIISLLIHPAGVAVVVAVVDIPYIMDVCMNAPQVLALQIPAAVEVVVLVSIHTCRQVLAAQVLL